MTPLDRAHLAAEAPGAPEAARRRFYALLAETALCVPLDAPPQGDADAAALRPLVFALDGGKVALAFDNDGRMAAFFEAPTEYVRLDGLALLRALAQAGLGLGLNLGDAPSATLLDAATVAWLAAEGAPALAADEIASGVTVAPPRGAERGLLAALAERAAQMPGLVEEAWLVTLARGDATGLALAVLPGPLAARAAEGIAAALSRAAAAHAAVEIALVADGHALLAAARRHGVGLHPGPAPQAPPPPPDAPPRLR